MTVLEFPWSDADEDVNLPANRVRPRRLRSRLVGLLAVWLLSSLGVLLGAAPAQAAAGGLTASDPEVRQELDHAPGWVTLAFDGKVDDRIAKVLVLDAKGGNVTAGPLIVEDTNVATQLEDGLPKGTYTVHYRVNGKGGEPRGGAFQFSYGGGSFSDPADASWSGRANEPEVLRGNDPNGPEQPGPAETESPGVEVTSSEKPDRSTQVPAPTKSDPDDPDDPGEPDVTDDPTAGTSSDDPSAATASAVPSDDGVGTAFLVGGVVLLLGVAGAAYAVYRNSKRGTHS
jgi:methionine-rich copper-binding protein CopC